MENDHLTIESRNHVEKKIKVIIEIWICPKIATIRSVILKGHINTLRPRQDGRHFADDIFKYIFVNENVWISLKISLKSVPKIRINNIPALVLIMAWCRPGDRPLFEPMMVSLLTHICVTRPQWVDSGYDPMCLNARSTTISLRIFPRSFSCQTSSRALVSSWTVLVGLEATECVDP